MKKIWAIGDIHGHFNQWMRLLKKITTAGYNPKKDTLIWLGDMIDGGSQTKQVVEWAIKDKKKYHHHQFLYGNHEDLMLDGLSERRPIYGDFYLWFNQGGKATYESYLPKGLSAYEKAIIQVKDTIPQNHRDWLKNLPLYYETKDYFFVHAGVLPHLSLEKQKKKVEMGDPDMIQTFLWIRDQFMFSDYNWGKKIIFGHTAREFPLIMKNKIGLDGMFHNTGNLYALELPNEVIYSEPSE